MAQTLPLSLAFNQCLGSKEDPYAFSSVHLEDLRSGKLEHLVTVQQLLDAIPKTVDPASRFTLRGQDSPTRHQRLHHSIKAALWWLVPSDGEFQRAPNGTHYYLARQGRAVVLRGGDVTQTLFGSRMNWIYDPAPPAPRRATMHSSNTPVPSHDIPVLTSDNQASAIATRTSSRAPLTSPLPRKCRQRRRRRARHSANRNSAFQRATQHQSEASDPTQMKRTAVYSGPSIHSHPFTQPPISAANRNSAFPLGLERCKLPGLYKLAFPDLKQDLTARPFRVNNSGSSLSSPSHLHPYTKPFSGRPARPYMTCPTREAGGALRERPGIVYPLMPLAQRPDTSVAIKAALPEAATVGRQALPPTVVDIGTTSQPQPEPSTRRRASRKPSRKRRRNRSTGVFRPPKRSPPHGRWCD